MLFAVSEMFICSKLAPKSLGDGIQAICKDTKSHLGPVDNESQYADSKAEIVQK